MSTTTLEHLKNISSRLEAIEDALKADSPPTTSLEPLLRNISTVSQRIVRRHFSPKPTPKSPAKDVAVADPVLVELNSTLSIVRDRVKGVALHGHAGFYLYGRAGTAKTYTVRTTLDDLGCHYVYQNGHITPIGLFEVFEENPDGVIVLDDVASIFQQVTAKNILLAALGTQPDGSREIKYKRKGKTVKVRFRGGVIAISNIELHGDEVLAALKSRVQTLNYNPTDDQIEALMRHIARQGHRFEGSRMTPQQCGTVAEFVIEQTRRLELKPDVRMLVDKAFKDYLLWKSKDAETHWRDLVRSAMEDQLVKLKAKKRSAVPTKDEETVAEVELVKSLLDNCESPDEVIEEFVRRTGKSKRTCQRRMRELRMSTGR